MEKRNITLIAIFLSIGFLSLYLGISNFGEATPGKMVKCYDEYQNEILGLTCYDLGVSKEQAILWSSAALAFSFFFIILGIIIWKRNI